MNDRLQILTDKIYQEGISRAQEDAERIKAEAIAEAGKILDKAGKESERIITAANKMAGDIRENTYSEIKLASRQAIEALKIEVINLVNGSVISPEIKSGVSDINFIQRAIESLIKNWASDSAADPGIKILIPERDELAIKQYFGEQTKGFMDKGFTIETVNGIKSGFQVTPRDGSYKISFTDQDFIAFFQEFLRPKVAELLFDRK